MQNSGLIKKIFVPILIGIGILVASEALLIFYYNFCQPSRKSIDPYQKMLMLPEYKSPYIYRAKPHIKNVTGTEGAIESINNFSMRRKADITEIPQGKVIRILSYGDSIGFGVLVDDEHTYSSLLEQLLNVKSSQKYEVLYMFRGYCPSIYAMHLKRDIFQFKPQYVIMEIELSNDVGDEAMVKYKGLDEYGMPKGIAQARYWIGWLTNLPMSENPSFFEKLKLRKAFVALKLKFSSLMNKIHPNPVFTADSDTYYYNLGFDRYFLTKKRLSESFDRMFNTIRAEQKFCNRNKIGFLLVIIPSRYGFYKNQYQAGAIRLIELAEARSKKLDIPYISLRRAFQEHGGYDLYLDFCHPTQKGNEVIAAELDKYFKSL